MLRISPRISSIAFWLAISLVTFLLLMEPQSPTNITLPHIDKLVHATLFGMLTYLGYLAYTQPRTWLCVGLVSYGAITEVLQGAYTLTRHASLYDWLADITGVVLSLLIMHKLNAHDSTRHAN